MFNNISQKYPILGFELQQSYFLRDCLKEEISYTLKGENLIIYKKLDNGISEEITLDELIFYIHTDDKIHSATHPHNTDQTKKNFYNLFKNIDTIKKSVENMKIILKYDNCDENDENDENESNSLNKNSECDEKNIDHGSLAF